MKRLFVALSPALLVLLLVAAAVGAGAASSSRAPILSPHRTSRGETDSLNWAGYAVYKTGGSSMKFKDVRGSWVQPAGTCAKKSSTLAAFYVGIDGYTIADPSSKTVEQIGTEVDCSHGTAVHYAWYEMYPNPPVYLDTGDYPVAPGDTITAEVTYSSGSSFTLTLDSDHTGGSWPFTVTLDAPVSTVRTTAEWIAEMPATGGHYWPLTNFGSITFSGASVTNDGDHTGNIADTTWNNDQITLVKRGRGSTVACTGALTGGSSFTVTYGGCS
jgi:hypothetical protein